MEPLAALGAASNVLQFIHFASKLISTTAELGSSVHGASDRTLELKSVYERLKDFSTRLSQAARQTQSYSGVDVPALPGLGAAPPVTPKINHELRIHIESMGRLADDCIILCEELLETIDKLQIKGQSHRSAKAFLVALKMVWDSNKIKDLTSRIDRLQNSISMHFFPILSQHHQRTYETLTILRQEGNRLRLDQTARFDDLGGRLKDFQKQILHKMEEKHSKDTKIVNAKGNGVLTQGRCRVAQEMDPAELKQIEEGVSNLVLTDQDLNLIAREQEFLKTLDFASRPRRHDGIVDAHRETFRWALGPSSISASGDEAECGLLWNWLRRGNGLFWISGKAGSGKSTLMKFLAGHDATRAALEEWTGDDKLVIAAHYFWTAGTTMQRSHEGLLRALLYDIFCASPEQIPDICPTRWTNTSAGNPQPIATQEWSIRELLDTLHHIGISKSISASYCLFVDGLDEFDVQALSLKQAVECFQGYVRTTGTPTIHVHNLTYHDVHNYAQSELSKYPLWVEPYFTTQQMQLIVTTITEMANGVFLWVVLVTRLLREGLIDGDTWVELQNRLNSFPPDLEPFIKQMLERISPIHGQSMAHMLRTAVNAREPLPLTFYQTLEYEALDKDYALDKSPVVGSPKERLRMLDQCQRRMNARCGGLLEVKSAKVEFLHRTVRDFLLTREISDYLCDRSSPDFMVNLSTLKSYLFLYKFGLQEVGRHPVNHDKEFWRQGLAYTNDALDESEESAQVLLGAIDDVTRQFSDSAPEPSYLDSPHHFDFRYEIVRAGVDRYISRIGKETPRSFNAYQPLNAALVQPSWNQSHAHIITQIVESIGWDYKGAAARASWDTFLQQTCGTDGSQKFGMAMEHALFMAFLKNGAPKNISVQMTTRAGKKLRPRTPLTLVVLALFQHNNTHHFPQQSLGTLTMFTDGDDIEIARQMGETIDTLHDYFSFRLGGKYAGHIAVELRRLRFLNEVMQRLITRAVELELAEELQPLIPELVAAFPGMGSMLKEIILEATDAQKRKRHGDEAPYGVIETLKKIRRLL